MGTGIPKLSGLSVDIVSVSTKDTSDFLLEKSLVSALVRTDNENIKDTILQLEPEDFSYSFTKSIFAAVDASRGKSQSEYARTLIETLASDFNMEHQEASRLYYEVLRNTNAPESLDTVREYTSRLRGLRLLREYLSLLKKCIAEYKRDERRFEDVTSLLRMELDNMLKRRLKHDPKLNLVHLMGNFVSQLEHKRTNPELVEKEYIKTGSRFDDITTGMSAGDYIVIAARPSMGKTAFLLNIAVEMAKTMHPVVFFSVEMPAEKIMMRLISIVSNIPFVRLKLGLLNDEEMEIVKKSTEYLASIPLDVLDATSLTVSQALAGFKTVLELFRARFGDALLDPPVIIVDYLQLMAADKKTENRFMEVGRISSELKNLAQDTKMVVIAAAQLNRQADRDDRVPRLSDLRESGNIEQDADVVAALYSKPDMGTNVKDLVVLKNRNGPTGVVRYAFVPETMKFVFPGTLYTSIKSAYEEFENGNGNNGKRYNKKKNGDYFDF